MSFIDVEDKLIEKLQLLNNQGNNEQFLQMDLLMKMMNLRPVLRPSVVKMLHHPLFWTDKRCLEFILDIQKKFDVSDPKVSNSFEDALRKVLQEPIVRQLKVALDLDKSVVHNNWTAKLDAILAEEFNRESYYKESVSDLLRAMRNKVIISLNS